MFYKKRRLLISVLCLLLVLLLSVSCENGKTNEPIDTTTTTTGTEEVFVLDRTAYAVIPADDANSDDIKLALRYLTNATEGFFDRPVRTSDDWYRGEMVRFDVEILIGETNRPESIAAAESLSYLDYCYEVVSPTVVVVCGGSDEATRLAMERFLKDCYGYQYEKEVGACCEIPVGTSFLYKHDYTVKSFSLCGSPIDSYSIVHTKAMRNGAMQLQDEIQRICGVELPLVVNTNYQSGNAIFVGMAKTDGSHADRNYGKLTYAVTLEKSGNDNRLFIDSSVAIEKIVSAFADRYLRVADSETLTLTFDDELLSIQTQASVNELTLQTVTNDEVIADGVVYRKMTFRDRAGKPVLAFVIEADLSKVSVVNATPNNGEEIRNVKATTRQAMQSLVAAGQPVLAGINADFFRISSDYSPQGLCIKDGKVLSDITQRPWFGVKKDGTPVIGTAEEYSAYYEGELWQAVGGSGVILRDGVYFDLEATGENTFSEFSATRHPRTAVGFNDQGKLFFVVVDGRSSASNGASLLDLADIMLGIGATDALNLDGGGSSTMITYQNNLYTTRNSPSDGSLRSVFNSLVLVAK